MFSLTIVFGPGPMVWTLMFKTVEEAKIYEMVLTTTMKHDDTFVTIKDDFGQEAVVVTSEIKGWMIEDLEQSRLAHIERALHQARTQAKGSELADADPVLRQARMKAQGGLGMIQPVPGGMMGNGRFTG